MRDFQIKSSPCENGGKLPLKLPSSSDNPTSE